MNEELEKALTELTPIQREAVNWENGAALILAGPGAGKTRVLTVRIARLLNDSPTKKFRVLALTFTTKAATEMRDRVEKLVPGITDERTFIGTFHAFCAKILSQHGSHIGICSDFGIIGQNIEQDELLSEAIQNAINAGRKFSAGDIQFLPVIRKLKSQMVTPEKVLAKINNPHLQEVYKLYEETLRKENLMDFDGLILETCRLLSKMPAIAARIRMTYPYWMIDEFQDTTPSQSWLLYYLSGGIFKNVFVVADDDQIIYQWNGASYRQIENFRAQYKPEFIQLIENHRCPSQIVEIANQLVAYNTQRTPEKKPTIASRDASENALSFRIFETEQDEARVLADEIALMGKESWGKIAILARSRSLLEQSARCLKEKGVDAVLAQRRDNFISPQFVWLQSCMDQVLRPLNKRTFTLFINSANKITGLDSDPALLMMEAEVAGHIYIEHWASVMLASGIPLAEKLGSFTKRLIKSHDSWKKLCDEIIPVLLETAKVGDEAISDADEDYSAWCACIKEIRSELGYYPGLVDIIQGISLRSKEPPRDPNAVTLLTVHASKGLEFDIVYVVGLAEGEMPSWQSCSKGDASSEMEEERRNCFVAITRTQEKLILSTAKNYRGYSKNPSRFLKNMSLIE